MRYLITILCICFFAASTLPAGERCDSCGCQCKCQKVCRVVCELKEVKSVCYDCRCEDFCIPGKSCKVGHVCECDPCNPGSGCKCLDYLLGQRDCETCRNVWQPSCEATIRTKNILIKREVSKKVPTYKWVVESCCPKCSEHAPKTQAAAFAELSSEDRAGVDVTPEPTAAIRQVEHTVLEARPRTPWERLFKAKE